MRNIHITGDKDLDAAIEAFKPVFGSDDSLYICELLGEMEEAYNSFKDLAPKDYGYKAKKTRYENIKGTLYQKLIKK